MMIFGGFVFLLIGLASSIFFLNGWYRGIKAETKLSKKVLFSILGLLDILDPFSFGGLALVLSLIVAVIGFALVIGIIH